MAVYAIGDLQGCYDPFRRLLDAVDFDPGADTLWLVGDLVNRGPKSLKTLRFVKSLGESVVTVLGNHDLHLLALSQEAVPLSGRFDSLTKTLNAPDIDELIDWLRRRPLAHYSKDLDTLLVHAGTHPTWSVSKTLKRAAEVEAALQGPKFATLLTKMYGNRPSYWAGTHKGYGRLRHAGYGRTLARRQETHRVVRLPGTRLGRHAHRIRPLVPAGPDRASEHRESRHGMRVGPAADGCAARHESCAGLPGSRPVLMHYEDSADFAARLDRDDSLAGFRDRFEFPDDRGGRRPVYFCGHSLGLQPKLAAQYVNEELSEWARRGVEGHFEAARPWVSYHRNATAALAAMTGAKPSEVVAMNTLTVNLHVMMSSFYRPDERRRKILIESTAFPSDRYAVTSQIRMRGHDPDRDLLEWRPRNDQLLYIDDLEALLERAGRQTALLLLPGVQYYSGQVLDMPRICELAREYECKVGFDLAHAVGNIALGLHEWGPDFAAWCSYKYLNGGPGAIAGAFVHERHFAPDNLNQLHGWWGNNEATRFKMRDEFDPAPGADLWQLSCPPVLSFAPVLASLEIFAEAGLSRLIEKSRRLTGYLAWLIGRRFEGRVGIITPADERGCQLSLVVRDKGVDAQQVFRNLTALNVIGDWREPDVIRIAPAPLYNSFVDVFECAERLQQALDAA
jgi:kynureninase